MRSSVLFVIAVGAVAALSVACSGDEPPPTMVTMSDSADQVFFGLTHYLTIDGIKRVRVEADTAYFYESSQAADLFPLRVTFFSATGQESSTLTANEGTYHWRTGNMEARGDVVAVTPDERRLTTSVLRYDKASDRISGPNPFVFDAPNRHLEGDAFTSDPEFRNVVATRPTGRLGRVLEER